jgi:hypothetical protein
MATATRSRTRKPAAITVELSFRKETARTFVFGTDEEGAAITTVYVAKDAFPGDEPPEGGTITFTPTA